MLSSEKTEEGNNDVTVASPTSKRFQHHEVAASMTLYDLQNNGLSILELDG